ncbi:LysR family transcriptional regulator [Actinokineospora sp. UTMC 2448]|uniref:LysR family transcriptional regulator n=1 Tax=Actinokineospora sp. UTMC 2448 TaxID=2268449 RepID=UPI0021647B1E|nr:LysR family transcriptional regulator [Actinokineospora sp. UTMC 2448]UVS79490.1 HTH-type transcriptional regulator GltC [Actinokineospora sp. UTMC 2448]
MIDVRKVHLLRVLREYGTVTAAAAALRLTPSAVSQQIRALADEVGVELLRREGRGVAITSAAELLIEHGDRMAAEWERVRAELDALAVDEPTAMVIGGFPSALAGLAVPAASRLRASDPRLRITLTEAETGECFDMLSTRQLDIAVIVPLPSNPAPDDPRYEQHPLLDDPLDLLVAATHPLATRPAVALADAAHDDWIAAPNSIDQHHLILAACAAAGFAPRIAHAAQEWNAICALVAGGYGVCLLPRLAPVAADHAVVRLPLTGNPAPFRRLMTCVRRGSSGQRAVSLGLTALRQVASTVEGC